MKSMWKKKWGLNKEKPMDDKGKLIVKLDRIFSKYVRLRDSDKNGYGRCITCPKMLFWSEATAGHFVLRNRMATRFHEQNVNMQCWECNSFNSGRQFEHGQAIDRKYGKGTAEFLTVIGSARGTKISVEWLEMEIKKYKEKVKKMLTR